MFSFKLNRIGKITISPVASELLKEVPYPLNELIEKHRSGDWGNISAVDEAVNIESIKDDNGTVLSMYEINTEMLFIRTYLSPHKNERKTDIVTGWELN
jgi:hypothetical protein